MQYLLHDAADQARVIAPLRGLEEPRAHHACDYLNEHCERIPETADDLISFFDDDPPEETR
jgi:hypothetical protein